MLLDDIIDGLTDNSSDLVDALLKTKRLLNEIGRKELSEWVNCELNGYPEQMEVPKYRIMKAQVMANVVVPGRVIGSHPIPLVHLSEKNRANLENIPMGDPLAVIQEMSIKAKKTVSRSIPMEFNGILSEGLAAGQVQRAWCEISPVQLKGIETQVRVRLLDFVLQLKEISPETTSNADLKQKAKSADITSMFNNVVFGPGTNIIVGDHNHQTIANGVQAGDFQSLVAALADLRVPANEIEVLKAAVHDNASDKEGTVTRWLKSIGSDIASSAVKAAALAYLGLS